MHQEKYSSLSKEELQVKSKDILLTFSRMTQDQIVQLKELTRDQAICPPWFEHGLKRQDNWQHSPRIFQRDLIK